MGDDGSGDAGAVSSNELTQSQVDAINEVFAQVEATAKAIAGTFEGADELESISLDSQSTCPSLDLTVEAGTGTTVVVDFPQGCTNELYGESPISGTVTMMLSLASGTLNIEFMDLSIGDQTTSGSISATYSRTDGANTLAGDLDLTTSGVGTAAGSLTLTIDVPAGTITITQASLELQAEGGNLFAIEVSELFINPVANGSFVPQAGSITFDVPNEGAGPDSVTVIVGFDEQSPQDRTVSVTVGNAPPVEYTLPG